MIETLNAFYRVQFRRTELNNKTNARLAETNKAYNEELLRQERLKALAASVPYYDAVNSMRSNIHKTTLARMNDYYEPSSDSGLSDFQMSKLNGFTNERMFSDPKFRKLNDEQYTIIFRIILPAKVQHIRSFHPSLRTCTPTSRARSCSMPIFASCGETSYTPRN
jgi:hypothetical protein